MKNSSGILFVIAMASLLFFTACRSEFERVRASADPNLLYEKAFEYYEDGDYFRAQTLLELIISSFRGRKEAEKIYFYYAYTHYELGKFILSSYYFKNFANTFTTSELREEAEYMSAYSYFRLAPSYRLDQGYSEKAIEGFQNFVNTYPNSERVEKCNALIDQLRRKLEKKAFAEAELYFNLRQYQAAVHSFENMLKDFPESPDTEKVRFLIVKSYYLLAVNSIIDKQEERFQAALDSYETFRRKYPSSEFDKELENIIDTITKKLNSISDVRY
jgi:outer membrane protein assembly factor BamD